MQIHTIQLNIAALEGGTRHMDATEFGAYMSLLIACYADKNHQLPDDNARLARIAKCTPHIWRKIRPTIEEKFSLFNKNSKKYWRHERVNIDIEKYKNLSEKNSENASKRWASKGSSKSESMPVALPSHTESHSESQCERNATKHQPPINKNCLTPLPTPSDDKPVNNLLITPKEKGVLKHGFNGVELRANEDVLHKLNDKSRDKAKQLAPGWDLYQLAEVYVEGINSGARDAPNSIRAAFPAWCGKYTKGKQP